MYEDVKRLREIITRSYRQQKIVNGARWIDNHNGTISCGRCHTWFYKNDRYAYMRYCPYCNIKMIEREDKK